MALAADGGGTAAARCGRIVVIGVGNELRRDDGVGPAVIERLRGDAPPGVDLLVADGDPARLIEAWSGASLAVVVDAVQADRARPGHCHRFVVAVGTAGAGAHGSARRAVASTHGLGLDEALSLAQALGRMPARLVVHAVEASDVTYGAGMTQEVAKAVGDVAAAVRREIRDVV